MMETGTFCSFDDTRHFYRVWNYNAGQKSILIMHRGHEHSGRLEHFACDARFAGYTIFSYDQRGLGYTEAKVSPRFMDYVRDLDCFVRFLGERYEVAQQDLFLVANSIAGVIVSGWLHDFAPRVAGVVMLAPAFGIKLYVPLAKEAVSLAVAFKPDFEVPSYVKAKVLTHSPEQQAAYNSDKLITHSINGALLVDMLNHGKRIVADAEAINTPTLLLAAEKDYVVKSKLQQQYFVRIDTTEKELKTIPGAYHGLLFETMRDEVYHEIAGFAARCFAAPHLPETINPDRFTLEEYHKMMLKMMPCWEKMNFGLQRSLLPVLGRLSKGMVTGMKYGFDSGISLDYVYRNQAQGVAGIGKLIDRGYLDAIGWRGIRIRKRHLLELLEKEIQRLKGEGKPVCILDIAGGTGNYLFDIKEKYPDVSIVINDFRKENVAFGEKIIEERGFTGIRFTCGDCFSKEMYARLDVKPNIVVISGIFELFGDNRQVNCAVQGVASVMATDGCLIYTGQPWHPQLKMIAHVLNSHRGMDWVMRRRSQKELDKLFRLQGFQKERMLIDDFGIFTVSCARFSE